VPAPPKGSDNRLRLEVLIQRARTLEVDGLPGFPIEQIRVAVAQAIRSNQPENAAQVLKRGEALMERVTRDWTWVKELLKRADELRAISATIGVDLSILDARVGNPRTRLLAEPLSAGALEKAAASASLALAVLNDAVPKFCVQEAQKLGASIRAARDRGEEVREVAAAFSRLLQALQDEHLPTAAQRLVEVRRAVARIPRAPPMAPISGEEEEEILLEARNLARRLQRIKTKAHDAHSAARLMSQVRQALAEDRRFGTPEEEIEALWLEVDRITRERRRAAEAPPVAAPARDERRPNEVIPAGALGGPAGPPGEPAHPKGAEGPAAGMEAPSPAEGSPVEGEETDTPAEEEGTAPEVPSPAEPEPAESDGEPTEDDTPRRRRGYLPPYVLPEMPPAVGPSVPAPATRPRLRPRLPP
jgi:hypothetical protein